VPPKPAESGTAPGEWSVSHTYGDIVEVFTACRTADVLAAPAPMPSTQAAVDNMRGYCFFLDADLAGICEPSPACWSDEPIEGHRSAIAIVVGIGRRIRPGEPGYDWISGSEQDNADLRATEIATVLTQYLGTLGYSATAHTAAASDLDRYRVSVEAGVLEVGRRGLGHPFLQRGFAVSVATTNLELTPDGPLTPRNPLQNLRIAAKHWLGWGGTRPGWSRLDGRHRPWHLGRYPMEKVKRVDEPTTLVIPEEVKRPAARHNFFVRAGAGELSRIGELVLNPFVGPRFKSGAITTDMPLTPDRPIDFGLQDFCTKCTKCARECPVGAIRFGDKVMFNGYEMWKPDVDRCARYRITNMRGSACGRCMKTCPYNIEGVLAERPVQWAAMKLPFARSWIARLDDKLGRGEINQAKKWWIDIEVLDNVPVEPPKGANTRGLNLDRKPRDESGFALFPPEMAPPGPDGMAPFPLDREAGIAASQEAERPAEARERVSQ